MCSRAAIRTGLVLWAASLTLAAPSHAQPGTAFEAQIDSELRAISPSAESLFEEANAVRMQNDHARAARLYEVVLEKAPHFDHALRRLGYEYDAMGDRPRALATLNRAVTMNRSAENLAALGQVLLLGSGGAPQPEDVSQAVRLLDESLSLKPDDLLHLSYRADASLRQHDLETFQRVTARMRSVAPDSVSTLYYTVIGHWAEGDLGAALAALERARAAGLPDSVYANMRASIKSSQPLASRLAWIAAWVGGVWLAAGLLLFALGSWLSRLTLRASERVPTDPSARVTGFDAWLRRAYRIVLAWCCVYYYVSMPILLVLVLVIGGGLLYGMLAVGHMPVKLLFIVGAVTLFTAWAIVRSLLVRARDEDPGQRLDLDTEPALRQVLEDVASRVGTRPVDTVFLTPGTAVAVFERGGMMRQLRGHAERCLILGAGVLDGFQRRPFRAVLAHEYGHFSNRDTAGGGFALAVRRSTMHLAIGLAQSGTAAWYNPAWLFVNGFHRLFLRISQGASRLQEVLADRWSATIYGARAFEAGLRHVIECSVRFDAHVQAALQEVVKEKRPLANLYAYVPQQPPQPEWIAGEVKAALEREPSVYDSHPRPLDRFRWVQALGVEGEPAADDDEPVWTLFSDRHAIEERMTGEVREAVEASHGVSIAGAPAPA
jgi:Zn-dependent protease with chaperone function/tetratricopeptide (TPR) repeat protein